ncbi:MAG TPA: AAA-like domain-containing protein [Hymenobacter sp.]|uniref:AAA-like domain-containing protein n=1 Tax=Hymenobacter sp. TaxID=1898978 RepID=UPI002D8083AA|nr:AAA-like domain-containing protein [Hymenobacter sp.]HET9505830.1 AAA-like domain-containing protein [Hymenobacter sp.]
MKEHNYVGLGKDANLSYFDKNERNIIDLFSNQWLITRGTEVQLSNSTCKAILIKPTSQFREMFNLDREVIVVFSPYQIFEPRSIDAIDRAFDSISSTLASLRTEEICSVIISNDDNIESKINKLLINNEEAKVIVPFSYKELLKNISNDYFIENRFRKYFYNRDLFGFNSPIQKESYFFGRRDFVQELVDKHMSSECSGIFGLRKTGKTSILFSLSRVLKAKGYPTIFIDCQDTAVYKKRWNKLLYYIISELSQKYSIKLNSKIDDYSEESASEKFAEDLKHIYIKIGKKRILLVFDEVERITFDISDEPHWKSGVDFKDFWRSLRGNFQKNQDLFSYLISSTNPLCVETRTINGSDNPIYQQIAPYYIQQFSFEQTRIMLNKLGGYMGMQFEDVVCASITQDYGGHPFLMRQVCSVINALQKDNTRPITINRIIYERAKSKFESELGREYSAMILDVLRTNYDIEFEMLEHLARGDKDFFLEHALEDSNFYTGHLIGYGVIYKSGNDYDFKIDTLKTYLAEKNKFKKLIQTNAEKIAEISARRNSIEVKLRRIVRNQLKANYGEETAKKKVIKHLHEGNITKFNRFRYNDLFDNSNSEIKLYFSKLKNLMEASWEDCFRHIFDTDVNNFSAKMTIINSLREADAHASEVKDYDMSSFRGAMGWLEEKVEQFEN